MIIHNLKNIILVIIIINILNHPFFVIVINALIIIIRILICFSIINRLILILLFMLFIPFILSTLDIKEINLNSFLSMVILIKFYVVVNYICRYLLLIIYIII